MTLTDDFKPRGCDNTLCSIHDHPTETTRRDRDNGRRRADIPEWLLVQEMDRARRVADDARRIHDTLAAELGFERVRINDVKPGDVIAHPVDGSWVEVAGVCVRVDEITQWTNVDFTDAHTGCEIDDGQMVSRQLPIVTEAF